jgi:hypothetical protein
MSDLANKARSLAKQGLTPTQIQNRAEFLDSNERPCIPLETIQNCQVKRRRGSSRRVTERGTQGHEGGTLARDTTDRGPPRVARKGGTPGGSASTSSIGADQPYTQSPKVARKLPIESGQVQLPAC